MRLKKQDTYFSQESCNLQLNTLKTGASVTIPLPSYAVDIINKYKTKAGKYVLPRLSNTNLNLQLKTLAEKAGWTYLIPKVRHKQGIASEMKTVKGKCYRFCDHITTHTMRRTAITTLLMMGVSETIVRTISGHAPGSKEFYKYVAIVQNYLNDSVRKAHEKLVDLEQ
jgi:integrase